MEKKMETTIMGYMVAPKYYNPYYWDPKKVPLILGNPHIGFRGLGASGLRG